MKLDTENNKETILQHSHPAMLAADGLADSSVTPHFTFTMVKVEKRKDRMTSLMNQMLLLIEARWENDNGIAAEATWLSTRQLAEHCQLGIYQARHLLLKLVEAGYVQATPGTKGSTLRWHVSLKHNETLIKKRNAANHAQTKLLE
ncbi:MULTISPECIES: FaeA/PapI family transcriptional regulator [Serratia]|jgi:hypothetical protein|nr:MULTISPECIES: FaeA/PapI family transcriptional regulator [Serratia]NYA16566.1 hypothetical protein [Serratia fonticola]